MSGSIPITAVTGASAVLSLDVPDEHHLELSASLQDGGAAAEHPVD